MFNTRRGVGTHPRRLSCVVGTYTPCSLHNYCRSRYQVVHCSAGIGFEGLEKTRLAHCVNWSGRLQSGYIKKSASICMINEQIFFSLLTAPFSKKTHGIHYEHALELICQIWVRNRRDIQSGQKVGPASTDAASHRMYPFAKNEQTASMGSLPSVELARPAGVWFPPNASSWPLAFFLFVCWNNILDSKCQIPL